MIQSHYQIKTFKNTVQLNFSQKTFLHENAFKLFSINWQSFHSGFIVFVQSFEHCDIMHNAHSFILSKFYELDVQENQPANIDKFNYLTDLDISLCGLPMKQV